MRKLTSICCAITLCSIVRGQLPPIGEWREHLSYNQTVRVCASSKTVYCSTPYALFSVDMADNNIERYSKLNGLQETGIACIQYEANSDKLVIAYTNSNIDVLAGSKIYNVPDFKLKDITADKTVYNILCYQDKAFLSTGIGIVVVDELKYEIKDTYIIGDGGAQIKINGFCTDGSSFYAATAGGIKKAPVNASNLSDYRNWQNISGQNGLPAGACADIVYLQNTVIVLKNDSLYALNNGNWSAWYTDGWHINNVTVSNNRIVLSEQKSNAARVLVITSAGAIEKNISQSGLLLAPQQSISTPNAVWVADSLSGLLAYSSSSTAQRFQPNSPFAAAYGEMQVNNNILWAASGAITADFGNTFSKNGIYRFGGEEWTNYNAGNITAFDTLYDVITIAADPTDNSAWGGSFGGGLFHLGNDGKMQVFKKNSPLWPSLANANNYFISGLAFDKDNNLWIANYGSARELAVKKTDGNWYNFFVPFGLNNNAVSQIITDDFNQKWIVSPGNGLICFNSGASPENSADDKWKLYTTGRGTGNLPNANVICVNKDKNGFIWVGTQKGLGVIQCPQDIFSSNTCDAVQPVVQQDNFAGYLFADEQVQTIATDGANRKWAGTKNGVWLLSAEGDKIIYRFTTDNSPLPDNDVRRIAINGSTGEVFFSTVKGICSFRSTATEGQGSNSNVLVFPNPVPPGYTGSIAIKGIADNAIVKITELDGRLVYQTRALGGQAVWNGKNYKGATIATGVYLVLISDDSRTEKAAAKIVFISK